MSMDVEYSVLPRRTSGGLYHRVTTSLEKVLLGTDLALARPKGPTKKKIKCGVNIGYIGVGGVEGRREKRKEEKVG